MIYRDMSVSHSGGTDQLRDSQVGTFKYSIHYTGLLVGIVGKPSK